MSLMRSLLRITNYVLILTSFLFLLSCTTAPATQPSAQTTLIIYRFDPPAFVEFSDDFQPMQEVPFSIPLNCSLFNIFSAPVGAYILIELSCPNGQTVLFLDTETKSITQPITDSDSHFLSWRSDGRSAYLKVDSLGNARVVQVFTDGKSRDMDVTGWTYDLAGKPDSDDFLFTFSRGLGSGSELNFTHNNGRSAQTVYADAFNYISFARYSPDGQQIAFIKIPDSATPFTVGELWVMDADGSNQRKLGDADAGHGYAPNWSPNGRQIAFVQRENIEDESADQSPQSLISNIYIVDVESGTLNQITQFDDGYAETPLWSPDGNTLAFNVVINGRMHASTVDIATGQTRSLITDMIPNGGPNCCPAWMRK